MPTNSPYLQDGRLQQILAAIQCMSIYKFYRQKPEEWAKVIGYGADWEKIFNEHPEVFRESPTKPGHYALVYRRALLRLANDDRPPLQDTQINALIDLVLRLHAIASGLNFQQHAIDRSPLQHFQLRERAKHPAFICHDSRDKAAIALPLALEMERILCPVWLDEFSLQVGQNLRTSIEKGLRECKKCIFIITPNFLANGGWTKREYEAIFTREIVEQQELILPIWHTVNLKELTDYSPVLANRVALKWGMGVEYVAKRLKEAIEKA